MKIISIRLLVACLLLFLVFPGCKKADDDYFSSEFQNMMRENALLEAAFDDALKVAENILMNNNNAKIEATGAPLGCITDIDTVVTGPASKTYTINFSSSCTSYDGKERTGTMIVELSGTNYNTAGASVTIRFSNFYINGNHLEGKLVSSNLGSGVFQVLVSDEADSGFSKLTFADGKISQWRSAQKRTIIEGNSDMNMINNKYTISAFTPNEAVFGGITSDNRHYWGTPLSDLLLDYGCIASGSLRYPIDGEIQFMMKGTVRKVNYGDGLCDYAVTMISGSTSKDFNLY